MSGPPGTAAVHRRIPIGLPSRSPFTAPRRPRRAFTVRIIFVGGARWLIIGDITHECIKHHWKCKAPGPICNILLHFVYIILLYEHYVQGSVYVYTFTSQLCYSVSEGAILFRWSYILNPGYVSTCFKNHVLIPSKSWCLFSIYTYTPLKINIEPEKWWFGRWFSFSRGVFSGSMLNMLIFWGENTNFHVKHLP